MAKIKAIDPTIKGMKLQIPVDGLISIDATGIAVVSDKAAKILVEGTNDWEYIGEGKGTETAEKTGEQAENDAEQAPETADEDKSDDNEVIEGIKKMNLQELISMAEEAGYDKAEWEKFATKTEKSAVKLMSVYLIKKYNADKE